MIVTSQAQPPVQSDEGVSPIVATVLLVAITIVTAGVLLVLAQGLGTNTDQPAQLVFVVNDARDRATVQATAGGPAWDEIDVRMSAPGGWALNGPAATGTPAGSWIPASGGQIYPGNYLDFCLDSPGGELFVDVRHTDPTLGVTTMAFTNVGSC